MTLSQFLLKFVFTYGLSKWPTSNAMLKGAFMINKTETNAAMFNFNGIVLHLFYFACEHALSEAEQLILTY